MKTPIRVSKKDQQCTTTSKNVADVFGKNHRDVLRAIRLVDCSDEFGERNFALSSYTSEQNKVLPCVEMTKDGFTFLVMGFTGEKAAQFKEAYIAEFNRMADTLSKFDSRIDKLTIEGKRLDELGRDWGKFGHDVKIAKRKNKEASKALLGEIQMKLPI